MVSGRVLCVRQRVAVSQRVRVPCACACCARARACVCARAPCRACARVCGCATLVFESGTLAPQPCSRHILLADPRSPFTLQPPPAAAPVLLYDQCCCCTKKRPKSRKRSGSLQDHGFKNRPDVLPPHMKLEVPKARACCASVLCERAMRVCYALSRGRSSLPHRHWRACSRSRCQ